jgi:hypothetical protein
MRAASFVVRSDHSRPLVNCLQVHPLFQQLTETWDSEWLAISSSVTVLRMVTWPATRVFRPHSQQSAGRVKEPTYKTARPEMRRPVFLEVSEPASDEGFFVAAADA